MNDSASGSKASNRWLIKRTMKRYSVMTALSKLAIKNDIVKSNRSVTMQVAINTPCVSSLFNGTLSTCVPQERDREEAITRLDSRSHAAPK